MNVAERLQELGLSRNEAKVYSALLATGRTTAGPVVSKTGLHRMIVYEAFEKLSAMRLISTVTQNNRKYFLASDPHVLGEHLERKEQIFKTVLPQLLALKSNADDQLEVKLLYGQSGFISNLETIVTQAARHDGVMRIIGGGNADAFYTALGDGYDDYVALLKRKKIVKHLIAADSVSAGFKQRFAQEKGNKLRTLKVGLSSPTFTRVTPDMVSIEIYARETIVIQIFNRSVAQGYRDSFELLWKQAKPYPPSRHGAHV